MQSDVKKAFEYKINKKTYTLWIVDLKTQFQ